MDDLISREAAIKGLLSLCPEKTKPGSFDEYGVTVLCGAADVVIKGLPAVDAVPVVRCKDCKHRPIDNRGEDDRTGFAIEFPDDHCPCRCEDGWYNWYPSDDWFCAGGERRDEDGNT